MLIMNITQCNQINCMIIIHSILLIFVNHTELPLYKRTKVFLGGIPLYKRTKVFLGGIIVHMNSEATPHFFSFF